ncbi:PREDICTED: putative leucine-rich repeat receptor-like serine/threonine-protein kinase At2g24130 [Nelumbo nucifera]|uniref:non-specific serine/threonine protein kinase n=2 Tax=Nelumbo nucifera TaxID=4432 RepID=A0A822ZPC1_NELNU|nr:PREDICTED: putative leucine-rich repeat receptor-like serine/threonine-protein kinase At2g24130 [Nelumbo nucifera]DAD45381.1 TPA_asm: hypothetical protein HUJ06_003611 [Nelumbo nucifera]
MGFCTFSRSSFLCLILLFLVVSGEDNARSLNDRAALLSFMSGIDSDPELVLGNWNSSGLNMCNWTGVVCNTAKDRVVQLDLSSRSLGGIISAALSNLSFLSVLDLSGNFFRGSIPVELGALSMLEQLSLSYNVLEGKIPVEFGFLRNLVYLDLSSNRLVGQIPESLFCNDSSLLEYIDLSNNSLSGEIPLWNHCKLINLKYLLLWSNRLVGQIPPALANSTKLEWLDLESNSLTGELPAAIVDKTPRLQFLYLSYNNLISQNGNTSLEPFFSSLVNCSNFQELELAGNNLGGQLPSVIGNLSTTFTLLHFEENLLTGSIPPSISNLVNLTLLNLSSNLLNGSIPPELCRTGRLERFYLSNNSLTGEIPSALGDISHLGLLDLSRNKLSGSIPDSFSNLSQLRRLMLYENNLSGPIPPSLGKCINLEILDLSHNKLSGLIPSEVAGLSSLKLYLNLSSNLLQGPLPLELSKMDMILAIDLSSNNFSVVIPPQLGSCIALEYLNLSENSLQGPLPISIGRLPYLQVLDVSSNYLDGEISESLQASPTLTELNLSFNNFSGSITKEGAFATLTVDSFQGNSGLCGSIPGMKNCRKKRIHHLVVLPILLSLFVTLTLCFFGYPLLNKSKRRRSAEVFGDAGGELSKEEEERNQMKYPRISYQQLIEATDGFNSSRIIGSGRFGHVYKGILQDNTRIAVKVFDPGMGVEICSSFKRECQVLARTRHRNLMRIITTCSRPDFKALVFPLMANGSLETHLYPSHRSSPDLSLVQLVSICSDVAEGVAYLHHHSPVRVVHCDLKPSNILLDEDLTALVTDFGIARLVKGGGEEGAITRTIDSSTMGSTAGLLCGSVGYIAPEYGMGKRASTKGDVYSFGILLLEILTGKRPTDVLFHQDSSLHEWVKSHYPNDLEPIIEEALLRFVPPVTPLCDAWREIILELIELGLICTQNSPSMRPSILDVALEIGRLKQYLANP